MENLERIHELLEAIEKAYLTELLGINIRYLRLDVLNILEEDIIQDLERVLDKIKYYSQKVTNK